MRNLQGFYSETTTQTRSETQIECPPMTMKNMRNQKLVMENYYFPEAIIDRILSKLPVKDVIRCSVVCKSWNSLIKTPTFIQTHLNNQTSEHFLLCSRQSNDFHWNNPAASFGHYSKLLHPIYNKTNIAWAKDLDSEVVGACNGLICLAVSSFKIDPCPPVILWNPFIRKFGFLPSPIRAVENYRCEDYYFCYDSRIGDYKVVRIVKEHPHKFEVEVWSLARGTWKSLSNVPDDFFPIVNHRNNFVNGAFHWVQYHAEMEFSVSVVALDMVEESFRNVKIRQDIWREYSIPTISRYHGDGDQLWLTLIEIQGDTSFDVWVMKEYGVVESWTKLFNVCLLGSPEEEPLIDPFCLTKSGQVVVIIISRDGEPDSFKSYDPEDKQFRDFGNQKYKYYFMDSFVESLVCLGQTNVFCY